MYDMWVDDIRKGFFYLNGLFLHLRCAGFRNTISPSTAKCIHVCTCPVAIRNCLRPVRVFVQYVHASMCKSVCVGGGDISGGIDGQCCETNREPIKKGCVHRETVTKQK